MVFLPYGGAVVYHGGFVGYVVGGAWVPFPAKMTQGNLYMIITILTQFYITARLIMIQLLFRMSFSESSVN